MNRPRFTRLAAPSVRPRPASPKRLPRLEGMELRVLPSHAGTPPGHSDKAPAPPAAPSGPDRSQPPAADPAARAGPSDKATGPGPAKADNGNGNGGVPGNGKGNQVKQDGGPAAPGPGPQPSPGQQSQGKEPQASGDGSQAVASVDPGSGNAKENPGANEQAGGPGNSQDSPAPPAQGKTASDQAKSETAPSPGNGGANKGDEGSAAITPAVAASDAETARAPIAATESTAEAGTPLPTIETTSAPAARATASRGGTDGPSAEPIATAGAPATTTPAAAPASVAAVSARGPVVPADLTDAIIAVSSSVAGGLGGAVVAATPGPGIASHDPTTRVAVWAWTEAPAAVGDAPWSAVPVAELLATADEPVASSSEGPAAEAEPIPMGLGRIAESLRGNLAALDATLGHYLEGVDELRDLMADVATGARPFAWMMGAAVTVGAGDRGPSIGASSPKTGY